MAEVVPTGAGNPKQPNVGAPRSAEFGDGVDRSHQQFQNAHPDSEIPASLRSPVEATKAGLEAARNFNANNQNSWSDNSQGRTHTSFNQPLGD
jgi:hypothetical protein